MKSDNFMLILSFVNYQKDSFCYNNLDLFFFDVKVLFVASCWCSLYLPYSDFIKILIPLNSEFYSTLDSSNFFINNFNSLYYISSFDLGMHFFIIIIPLILVTAFFTLSERKIMAAIQRRRGPHIVGYIGLLQPLADGLKLLCKELVFPFKSNMFLYLAAPFIMLFSSLLSWSVFPLSQYHILIDIQASVLYILVISSLNIYGMLLSGWISHSKYSNLASIRSACQMLAFEILMGFISLIIILFSGSSNLYSIASYQNKSDNFIFSLIPLALIFFVIMLAETNRTPFDLAEAEAELVSGYNTEYSGFAFAAFFLGEYLNILSISTLFVIFFWSGNIFIFFLINYPTLFELVSNISFGFKIIFISILFIFIRANVPRYRFDQLITIAWKCYLPLVLGLFIFYISFIFTLDLNCGCNLPPIFVILGKF